jgi:hypothetical protein
MNSQLAYQYFYSHVETLFQVQGGTFSDNADDLDLEPNKTDMGPVSPKSKFSEQIEAKQAGLSMAIQEKMEKQEFPYNTVSTQNEYRKKRPSVSQVFSVNSGDAETV